MAPYRCFALPREVWDDILCDPHIGYADLARLGATCTTFRSLVASPVLDFKRHRLTLPGPSSPVNSGSVITLHPFLSTPSFHLQLPHLLSTLSTYNSTPPSHSVLSERITTPPLPELWLVILSHSLHITSARGDGVTIGEVLDRLVEFWEADVPLTWEGYSGAGRSARRQRKKAGTEDREGFTWWESVEVGRKDVGRCSARWTEAKVDSMGNVRLVVDKFET